MHRDSGLIAVICDDMVVRVVDIETRRVVRELGGFRGRVLDMVSTNVHNSHITGSQSGVNRLSQPMLAG